MAVVAMLVNIYSVHIITFMFDNHLILLPQPTVTGIHPGTAENVITTKVFSGSRSCTVPETR